MSSEALQQGSYSAEFKVGERVQGHIYMKPRAALHAQRRHSQNAGTYTAGCRFAFRARCRRCTLTTTALQVLLVQERIARRQMVINMQNKIKCLEHIVERLWGEGDWLSVGGFAADNEAGLQR